MLVSKTSKADTVTEGNFWRWGAQSANKPVTLIYTDNSLTSGFSGYSVRLPSIYVTEKELFLSGWQFPLKESSETAKCRLSVWQEHGVAKKSNNRCEAPCHSGILGTKRKTCPAQIM